MSPFTNIHLNLHLYLFLWSKRVFTSRSTLTVLLLALLLFVCYVIGSIIKRDKLENTFELEDNYGEVEESKLNEHEKSSTNYY
uniref:Uncharacterized protein n=1 Tax=Acrobeloides nanus TaxID=290746 RepID=A0A914CN06_9BILA